MIMTIYRLVCSEQDVFPVLPGLVVGLLLWQHVDNLG